MSTKVSSRKRGRERERVGEKKERKDKREKRVKIEERKRERTQLSPSLISLVLHTYIRRLK